MEKAPNKGRLSVIDGAGHYEMYDEPKYLDEAAEQIHDFFTEHLARLETELHRNKAALR